MAGNIKGVSKALKLAAQQIKAFNEKTKIVEAKVATLQKKLVQIEKLARARAIATKLVVGDDVRREIDEKTQKMASQDMDVIEKALELGRSEAVLKLGEAIVASHRTGNNGATGADPIIEFLSTLM